MNGGGTGRVGRKERARQLLDISLELIVNDGFGALTMAAVARKAGVSKPIVYRIYPNRGALLLALLRREQKRTDRRLDEIIPADPGTLHPREVLTNAVVGILDAVEESPNTWKLVLLPPEGTPRLVHELIERRREQLTRRASALIRWGAPYLAPSEEIDRGVLARVLVSIVQEQARMVLADPELDRAALEATSAALIDEVQWRERPRGA